MEDVLAVYTRPRDPDRLLVCLDETSKQLIAETRMPIPTKRGRPARVDYEYERNGTANLFMCVRGTDLTVAPGRAIGSWCPIGYASIICSEVIDIASKKVCIGVCPKHQRPW